MLGLPIGITGSRSLCASLRAIYEVEPHDAPTFGAMAALLAGAALLGSYLPAVARPVWSR